MNEQVKWEQPEKPVKDGDYYTDSQGSQYQECEDCGKRLYHEHPHRYDEYGNLMCVDCWKEYEGLDKPEVAPVVSDKHAAQPAEAHAVGDKLLYGNRNSLGGYQLDDVEQFTIKSSTDLIVIESEHGETYSIKAENIDDDGFIIGLNPFETLPFADAAALEDEGEPRYIAELTAFAVLSEGSEGDEGAPQLDQYNDMLQAVALVQQERIYADGQDKTIKTQAAEIELLQEALKGAQQRVAELKSVLQTVRDLAHNRSGQNSPDNLQLQNIWDVTTNYLSELQS
jgi:predicted  nucleic acid-binding Zn-ribbon protein